MGGAADQLSRGFRNRRNPILQRFNFFSTPILFSCSGLGSVFWKMVCIRLFLFQFKMITFYADTAATISACLCTLP